MWDLIGELVAFALVVAASPLPVIAVLLLLAGPPGLRGGALFALARVVALAAVVALSALLAELVDDAAESTWPAAGIRIVLGLVLVGAAVRKWLRRPRGSDAEELPGWMRAIDGVGAAGALRLGMLVTVANPKELAMAAGAGLALGGAMAPLGEVAVAGLVFLVLATLGATLPVLVRAIGGTRAAAGLADARDWFVRNNATLIAIVLLAIGALLIGGGIGELG
ncbi:MAG: GAP family protein [Micrococcales bacterium]|nr:GAP family protein [Micrococcales bacterium]OJX66765.1 MAG: hypothetical protein BGO94_07980 [Micrococcales bacterium 72-143]